MQTLEAELMNFSDVSIWVVLKAMKVLMGFCLSMCYSFLSTKILVDSSSLNVKLQLKV